MTSPAIRPDVLNLPGAAPAFIIPADYLHILEKGTVTPQLIMGLGSKANAGTTSDVIDSEYGLLNTLVESAKEARNTPVAQLGNKIAAALILQNEQEAAAAPPDCPPPIYADMGGLLRTSFTSFLAERLGFDEQAFTNGDTERLYMSVKTERYSRSLLLGYYSDHRVGTQREQFAEVELNTIFPYVNARGNGRIVSGFAEISQVPGALSALAVDAAAAFGPVWQQVPQISAPDSQV